MKNPIKNKAKLTATIAIVLLLVSAFVVMINVPVQAQLAEDQPVSGSLPSGVTPSEYIDVVAYLSFRPNPVGVNQWILINIWVTPPLNVERNHQNYTVIITDPDGNEDVISGIKSYDADATAWFEWPVDQVGTWTLQFIFEGEYYPAGNYLNGYVVTNGSGNALASAYYNPALTEEQELIVQEEPVLSWPPSPLPTDYWTRPAHLENREWWPILGNFPPWGIVGGGAYWPDETSRFISNYDFIPYVEAPETGHIVWKRLGGIAGIIGGSVGQYGNLDNPGSPSVIYAGRCYQTMDVPIDGVPTSCAACYDLRTGEMYYAIPTAEGGVTPNVISYARGTGEAVPGATEYNTYSATLMSIGNRLQKIDAYTGEVTLDVPGMSRTTIGGGFDQNIGAFHNDPYVLSSQNLGSFFSPNYRLINWTTAGNTENFEDRVVSNVSVGWSLPFWPGGVLGFTGNVYDFEENVNVWMVGIATAATGHYYGTWMKGFDLTTGDMLWNITFPETRYSTSCLVADHGKVALVVENGWLMCFNSRNGQFLWRSERMEYPWAQPSFGAYAIQSAYGMIFWETYGGVYAFDWDDGSIEWIYKAPNEPYETPYQDYNSFNSGGWVADGKLYTVNSEHTTTWPRTRGWKIHCIDAFTGEGIWNITGAMSPGAVADGYLVAGNSDDGYTYCFGKGKSATTVTAPKTSIPKGTALMIEGTVLDMSPAQPGTPCVSVDSMATQMEYLHMQLPIDGIHHNETITGVPVTLTAMAEDGSYIDIGTATTDGYYGTFGLEWTPPDEGTYKIIAAFAGDDSYGSSGAATYITVGPPTAPSEPIETEEPTTEEPTTEEPTTEEPTTEEPTTEEPTEPPPTGEPPIFTTEVAIILAVVIACIIGVGAFWALRRRK
ncbi:MAG: PQQ-binding-like beta-propeller repeat protein [Candidatus Bathyarchaeum sp.]|nr:MAG: PQQ-binding-like beta-propeller repeat protein [Candidatus Bathyarchaeum sp.]